MPRNESDEKTPFFCRSHQSVPHFSARAIADITNRIKRLPCGTGCDKNPQHAVYDYRYVFRLKIRLIL